MGDLRSIKLKCPLLKKLTAKEFTRWWSLFKAYAQQIGFADMLVETAPAELPGQEEEIKEVLDPNDKSKVLVQGKKHTSEQKKAVNRNATAIASFYTAFQELENMDCLTKRNK